MHGKVRSADTVNFGTMHGIYLKLLMDGGSVDASVVATDARKLKGCWMPDVEVTGVVSGKFDSKMQLIGILLEVSSLDNVKILTRAQASPDTLPITPMNADSIEFLRAGSYAKGAGERNNYLLSAGFCSSTPERRRERVDLDPLQRFQCV